MEYKIYAIDENRKAVPSAVAYILDLDKNGALITEIPFGAGSVLMLSSEMDSDLFLGNKFMRVTAPGYSASGTDLKNISNYNAYEFTIRKNPSMVKPIIIGVGITLVTAWLYGEFKRQ